MWYRRSVILRSFIGLLASAGWLCLLFTTFIKNSWLGFGVVPLSFLPAAIIAWRLAQRLDIERKEAFWIGVPTIVAMGLVTLFSFFMFSPTGERALASSVFSIAAVAVLASAIAFLYLCGSRIAFRQKPFSHHEKKG